MKKKGLLICALMVGVSVVAQDTELLDKQFTITTGLTSTSFNNENIDNDKYKIVDKNNGFNLGISYSKFFKDLIGVSIGLNYSSYSQKIYQKGTFEKFNQKDIDGEAYDLLILADITESYSVTL